MSATQLEQVFEPFYTTKKMGRSGTGLGMAVVWGCVKDHNGFVDIETVKEVGSTFSLYFPITHEHLEQSEEGFIIEQFLGKGESILIVDDSATQRKIAEEILKKLHYTPISVSSGEDAIRFLHNSTVDLLLLDMIMEPGIDGLETYRQIVKIKPWQKLVIASGFSETERVREIQKLSGCTYIKKPYTLKGLGSAVKREFVRGASK